jgi:hypothetical protein
MKGDHPLTLTLSPFEGERETEAWRAIASLAEVG